MPFATSLSVVDGPSVKSCCLTPSVSGGTSGTCPETLRDSEGLNCSGSSCVFPLLAQKNETESRN